MTNSVFEKRLNKVIYSALNGHRLINMYQIKIDFGCMVKYYAVDMFLRFKDKHALRIDTSGWGVNLGALFDEV